jgi:hypothetical protein
MEKLLCLVSFIVFCLSDSSFHSLISGKDKEEFESFTKPQMDLVFLFVVFLPPLKALWKNFYFIAISVAIEN